MSAVKGSPREFDVWVADDDNPGEPGMIQAGEVRSYGTQVVLWDLTRREAYDLGRQLIESAGVVR
jgi:hypothetical protein